MRTRSDILCWIFLLTSLLSLNFLEKNKELFKELWLWGQFLRNSSWILDLENDQCSFCFQAGVVSLQKLLVREKAGQDSKGIYLISSHPAEPEMFELKVHKPKDKQVWIQAIRSAVQCCPEEEEETPALSSEEKQKLWEAKQTHIRQIVGELCVTLFIRNVSTPFFS